MVPFLHFASLTVSKQFPFRCFALKRHARYISTSLGCLRRLKLDYDILPVQFFIKISFTRGEMCAVFQKWLEPSPFWSLRFPGICDFSGGGCRSEIKLQTDVRAGLAAFVSSLSEAPAFSPAALILKRETHYSSRSHLSRWVQPCSQRRRGKGSQLPVPWEWKTPQADTLDKDTVHAIRTCPLFHLGLAAKTNSQRKAATLAGRQAFFTALRANYFFSHDKQALIFNLWPIFHIPVSQTKRNTGCH